MTSAKVLEVKGGNFHLNKSNPPEYVVFANGNVPTSGWTNGLLIPWVYITPPEDGIQDFDFIATAPTGIVLEVITPIDGSGSVMEVDWLRGFRIHASTNSIEIMLHEGLVDTKVRMLNEGENPFPW